MHNVLLPAWIRRYPLWLKVVALMALPYVAWLSTYPKPTEVSRWVELGYLLLLSLLTPWTLWRASRRNDFLPGFRSALRWMAGAWVLNFIAGSTVAFIPASGGGSAPSWLTDSLYLLTYPMFFMGLSRLTKADQPLPGRTRILLDGAVFLVGVGAPLWLFGIHPTLSHGFNLKSFLAAAYPAMAFLGVMALNFVLLRCAPFPNRAAHHLLLMGLGLSWLGDLLFILEVSGGAILVNLKYWGNIINALGLLLNLMSAWRMKVDPVPARPPRPVSVSPIPIATIVLVGLWMVQLVGHGMDSHTLQRVLTGILLLILVILIRESLSLREGMRQGAEAATIDLRARFEALVRHSSDLILVLDPRGEVSFASPAAFEVLGHRSEALSGRRLREFLHPDDSVLLAAFLDELVLQPGIPLSYQCRMRHTDGRWRVLEISGSNLLNDPVVQGLVLNTRDITERHKLEDQLREAQKMEAVGRLAGGVAHDFNNLLSAILGNVELAENSVPEGHKVLKDLKRIHGAATRGAVLTGRLLAFCRRESPESKVIHPGLLIHGVAPLIEGLLGERVRLILNIEVDVWPITVDPNDFEQALLNMAANARDAMPEGGTVSLTLRNQTLGEPLVTAYLPMPAGDCVVLDVTDSGTGMDESMLSHLFEPFFTTKERGRGTGLGLASVYGMVQASHGGIDVRSASGQGTTIRLLFPKSSKSPEEDKDSSGPHLIRGSETILLVEDEPMVRETTERILTATGYAVLSASHADEARLLLKQHTGKVHLLLTDVIMPGDSGPVLAAELTKEHPDLHVLYMSGYTANELGPHGLARVDAPLLRKPFTVDQLSRRLRAVLAGPPGRI